MGKLLIRINMRHLFSARHGSILQFLWQFYDKMPYSFWFTVVRGAQGGEWLPRVTQPVADRESNPDSRVLPDSKCGTLLTQNLSTLRNMKILPPFTVKETFKCRGQESVDPTAKFGAFCDPICLLCGSESPKCLVFQENQSVPICTDTQMQLCKMNLGSHEYRGPYPCRLPARKLILSITPARPGLEIHPSELSTPAPRGPRTYWNLSNLYPAVKTLCTQSLRDGAQ